MRDTGAFDEFYRDTSARMLRYGYAITGDLADAQDVVQEGYARAWRQWRTVAVHPAPEAWVRLTVNRLATDRWRRIGTWRAALARTGLPPSVPPPSETTVLLVSALKQLPNQLRHAVVLHYLYDMPVAGIAAETGAAIGTVTSWLHRGRAELARILAPARTSLQEATDVE
jgi:RNA polymerase sigma-70 factor (ECF subfamily)